MADLFRSKLNEQDWLANFEDLALAASAAGSGEQRTYIELLLKLLIASAGRTQVIGFQLPDIERFFALLGVGGYETAALSLVPSSAGFMASNNGGERYVVSIVLAASREESSSVGRTLALAIVSTLALAIAESSFNQPDARNIEPQNTSDLSKRDSPPAPH